jgi:ion channel-forming bestrophin family protein
MLAGNNMKSKWYKNNATEGALHCVNNHKNKDDNNSEEEWSNYANFPLVQSMIQHETIRDGSFRCEANAQFKYPQSNSGWIRTVFTLRGRALDSVALPFAVVTLHAIGVTVALQRNWIPDVLSLSSSSSRGGGGGAEGDTSSRGGDWTMLYGNILNFAISFLLVFRLNRAGSRYWLARQFWGGLVGLGRTITSGILVHGRHHPVARDNTIRWIAASAVAVMVFIRGDHKIPHHTLDGILDAESIQRLERAPHPPIYACDRARQCLKHLFAVTADTPLSFSHGRAIQMDRLEQQLNLYMDQFGGMERIRSTPLPMAYVAHLRTFLLIHLLLFPYVFGPGNGWSTIPMSILASFAFLGIEATSCEVENPFRRYNVNYLNMDAFVMAMIQNILQQVKTDAEMTMEVSERYNVIEV